MEVTMSTNDINNFSVSELNYIRESVENMNKFNQVEVLRLLNKHKDVTINENKYGIHINLSDLNKELLDELKIKLVHFKMTLLELFSFPSLSTFLQEK